MSDAARKLGEWMLSQPKLVPSETRTRIEEAKAEVDADERYTRIVRLVRQMEFAVKATALGGWMKHTRKLAQQIIEEIDGATSKSD